MIFVFYAFAAVLLWFSYKSFVGGIRYLEFFRQELDRRPRAFTPVATVIVPCRGLDHDLEENLTALFQQEYTSYEIIFVVDQPEDPAVSIINELIARFETSHRATLVVAPNATNSSQKVENLREAVLHADPKSEVFVFVDSDARVSPSWMMHLVEPLADEALGAATGYRWFISEKPAFGSELRSVWNASIASALGPNRRSNFGWGGSMAMRRTTFDRVGMRNEWAGTVSDDFTVARVLKAAGLEIAFVPQAITASFGSTSLSEMLEFTSRQMKLTRVYMPHLWLMSFFGSTVFNGVGIAALCVLTVASSPVDRVIAAATLLLVTVFSVGKAWLRLNAIKLVLPQYRAALDRQFWTQNTLWILSPTVFLINCVVAQFSRRINWRGTVYELKSPSETVIIRR